MRLRISWALAIIATAAGLTMTCLQASAPLGTPSSQPAAQPARSGNLGGPAQVLGRAAHDHHVLGVSGCTRTRERRLIWSPAKRGR